MCPFDCATFSGSGKVRPVNHTSLLIVVTQTGSPQSVCNRCAIEVFGDVFVKRRCFACSAVSIGHRIM